MNSDSVKSALMLGSVVVAGYAMWRASSAVSDLSNSVSNAASDAWNSASNAASNAWGTVSDGAANVTGIADQAGVKPWQIVTPGTAIGSAIGTAIRNNPNAVNPNSGDNLLYQGVNALGGYATGQNDWNFGGWIYDVTH